MTKTRTLWATALILLTTCLPAAASTTQNGPYSVRIGTGGIGFYLAPRGVSDPPVRGTIPSNSTQILMAQFRPGAFFTSFPNEHVAVILWGSPITLPNGQFEGRGITLGAVPGCNGIAIEEFSTGTIIPGSCQNITFQPTTTYGLNVQVSAGTVSYSLVNAGNGIVLATRNLAVPDQNPDPFRRDIMFAHTADDSYEGTAGSFELFNVFDGFF